MASCVATITVVCISSLVPRPSPSLSMLHAEQAGGGPGMRRHAQNVTNRQTWEEWRCTGHTMGSCVLNRKLFKHATSYLGSREVSKGIFTIQLPLALIAVPFVDHGRQQHKRYC